MEFSLSVTLLVVGPFCEEAEDETVATELVCALPPLPPPLALAMVSNQEDLRGLETIEFESVESAT